MKRRFLSILLAAVLCLPLSACGEKQKPVDVSPVSVAPAENTAQAQGKEPERTFPFKDDEGRTRYRLVVNGNEVKTENLPFTYPNDTKCGYYPLEDVLSALGVESLCSSDESVLTTKLNDKVLKVTAGVATMTYGAKTVKGLGTEAPVCIGDCLYVPSFLFMSIFDKGIVNFSGDRSAATLDTNTTINLASSGTAGLKIPSAGVGTAGNVSSNGSGGSGGQSGSKKCSMCNGSGRSICTYCSGTGSKIEYQQTYDPISKQYKQTQRTARCPQCSGSGKVTCSVCGGMGQH